MFALAVQSFIPLIKVTTTDLINVKTVLDGWLPKGQEFHELPGIPKTAPKNAYSFMVAPSECEWESLYRLLVSCKQDRLVVVVNPIEESLAFFDGGRLEVHQNTLDEFLKAVLGKTPSAALCASLAGCTLKEAGEVCRMASTAYTGQLTAEKLTKIRRQYVPMPQGLSSVSTEGGEFYIPREEVAQWVAEDGLIFNMRGVPAHLLPRGILFDGPPGTGKTQSAKFVARELELPLYRLSLGAMLNKWLGASEGNFSRVLGYIDTLSPCIFFIDEAEKLFGKGDDETGVTDRILADLLWWLQEHDSKVLTIMTTNDVESLPPELYREGRISSTLQFSELPHLACQAFVGNYMKSMEVPPKTSKDIMNALPDDKMTEGQLVDFVDSKLRAAILKAAGAKK